MRAYLIWDDIISQKICISTQQQEAKSVVTIMLRVGI